MHLGSVEPLELEREARISPHSNGHRPALRPKLVLSRAEQQLQGKLILTVQLCPPLVQQRWCSTSETSYPSAFRASTLHFANIGVVFPDAKGHQNAVEYHLPQNTLNHYTDGQGLERISLEMEAKTYLCQVLVRLTQLLLPSTETPHLYSTMFQHHFAAMLCAHVVHLHSQVPLESLQSRGGLSAWQKRVITDTLARHRYQNTKLSTLAEECQLSVSHFARSFKVTFGQPFHQWLLDRRVEKSKEFLLHSDSPLIEIAFQAGFSDQATFNRTFAKIVGASPGRWRRANKNKRSEKSSPTSRIADQGHAYAQNP